DLDGVRTIGLEDPHRPRRADTVAMQEDHDFPHCFLLSSENSGSANWSNAIDFTQPVRCCLDDVEHLIAKGAHQLLGVNRANASDHAGREIIFDEPSAESGSEVRRNLALNCWPWVRSLTHSPE